MSQGAAKRKKGIEPREDFLDCVGRLELAANEFRITFQLAGYDDHLKFNATFGSHSTLAFSTDTEPNRFSKAFFLVAPTPGMSSSVECSARLARFTG